MNDKIHGVVICKNYAGQWYTICYESSDDLVGYAVDADSSRVASRLLDDLCSLSIEALVDLCVDEDDQHSEHISSVLDMCDYWSRRDGEHGGSLCSLDALREAIDHMLLIA